MIRRFTHREGGTPYISTRAHTLSFLFVGLALLFVWASKAETTDTVTNVKTGIVGMAVAFLVFLMLQNPFQAKRFVRPHPAFWRVVLGVAIIYMLLLTFFLFQSKADARRFLTFIDPTLNIPLPERNYAMDCRIYTPEDPVSHFRNLKDNIQDEFFLAHLVGWWARAALFRDFTLTWTTSLLFEFVELAFEHMLPNFAECWWDKIILDVIGCNAVGIFLGMITCKYLEIEHCDWTGEDRNGTDMEESAHRHYCHHHKHKHHHVHLCAHHAAQAETRPVDSPPSSPSQTPPPAPSPPPAPLAPVSARHPGSFIHKSSFFQWISPWSFRTFRWSPTITPQRFLGALILCLASLVVDLMAFFMKTILWVPPLHPLNTYRLLLIFTIALPAVREYYEYITNPRLRRLGPHAWTILACIGLEMLVCMKLGKGEFPSPMPAHIMWGWVIFVLCTAGVFAWVTLRYYLRKQKKEKEKRSEAPVPAM